MTKAQRYNVFSVLGIQTKEVLICRMIADLLNPAGAHAQGDAFLRLFAENVLRIRDISPEAFGAARITTEYPVNAALPENSGPEYSNSRRIDIVIQLDGHFIPIEVKVYAGDQEFQCYDYYRFARRYDHGAKIYYLTPFGDAPGQYSTARETDSVPEQAVVTLSFQHDISDWLRDCQQVCASDTVREILMQFADTIAAITADQDEEVIKMTAKELSSSAANLEAGILIANAIDDAKANVLRSVFEEFERQMEPVALKYALEREPSNYLYYQNTITSKTFHGDSKHPGINYVVKNISLPKGYQLLFRIEVDWYLFAGFFVFDPGKQQEVESFRGIKSELFNALGVPAPESGSWWVDWVYTSNGTTKRDDTVPNFHNMNAAALRLADENVRTVFVQQSIETLEKTLLRRFIK